MRSLVNRRQFLALAAASGLTTACGTAPPEPDPAPPVDVGTPLRVPPLLHPDPGPDGVRHYELTLQAGETEILPGKQTPTWGFNGPFLGPTLRAARGDRVRMSIRNTLGEASTVHWHGLRLPAAMDGGPHRPVDPGAEWTPEWEIDQPAATAWYHPHPHGKTSLHLYHGLAGVFVIDDGPDAGLPSEYGVDDVPLILQDKMFAEDGSFSGDPLKGPFGILGDHVLVNGVYDPGFAVLTERVRFRVLNASNARMYTLELSDRRHFQVVGNDRGLLGTPAEVDQVPLTPGERVEIVVAFTPGEQVVLRTVDNGLDIGKGDFDLLRLVTASELRPTPAPGEQIVPFTAITPAADARVRHFTLNARDSINGRTMDMARIDEVVPTGAVEIWEVENSASSHNFHIHEVSFQILDVAGTPPPAHSAGYKDTVFVPTRSTVRLAVQFGRYADPGAPYMYHCHLLRHEDAGMMGQFVIVEPGTEDTVSRTLLLAHPGH
ncbi:multicopper oxidase family protein [Kitasatospora camelliae]|uniref:Multicopper oxidase CueO n=1 Tax=Kitasatospora camelliae TaxID=3156397 RepID=A0AAU8JQP2_9ACTN